jgi:hypothetical protein
MELVYVHPNREPYGHDDWRKMLKEGRLEIFFGQRCPVRQEGSIDGQPRFVCSVPDVVDGYRADQHPARPPYWVPTGVVTATMVEQAAQKALAEEREKQIQAQMAELENVEEVVKG